MLVIDANLAIPACLSGDFSLFGSHQLFAPPLLWTECLSALHEAMWRRELEQGEARDAVAVLERAPIQVRAPDALWRTAWRLADELDWAKTYDAEYLALATILDCPLVTLDGRMRREGARVCLVLRPEELT